MERETLVLQYCPTRRVSSVAKIEWNSHNISTEPRIVPNYFLGPINFALTAVIPLGRVALQELVDQSLHLKKQIKMEDIAVRVIILQFNSDFDEVKARPDRLNSSFGIQDTRKTKTFKENSSCIIFLLLCFTSSILAPAFHSLESRLIWNI